MKFAKFIYIICIISGLFLSGIAHADTCYDPNYDTYYNCTDDDEYIAPVAAGVLFGVILSNDHDGGGHWHNHGGGGGHGGHGGNGRHH